MRPVGLLLAALPVASCTGTTGYSLVSFYAVAEGPPDAQAGQPYTFMSGGYQVSLTKAIIHIGAIYLDDTLPTSGGAEASCTLPGTYVGEVRGGLDIDMLDPRPQAFPVAGNGSTIPAAVGQVWLSGPDVNAMAAQTDILDIEGTATKDGTTASFFGAITVDQSNNPMPTSTALPGSNPICAARIVTPIFVDITLAQGGTLVLHVDPTSLFNNADFSQIKAPRNSDAFEFTNRGMSSPDQPSRNLYDQLHSNGPYRFEWRPAGAAAAR